MSKSQTLAGVAVAAALGLSLALPASVAAQAPLGGGAVVTPGLPDITISVGYIGTKAWTNGGTVVLDDMGPVIATQVGPKKNLCRFVQMDYQPGNQGPTAAAGPSVAKVYRGSTVVNTDAFPAGYFGANSWRPFEKWQMDLEEGMNTVRVVLDANKQIAESNENNTFVAKLNVKLDCDGDGAVNGVPGGLKQAPAKPTPDPAQPRRLRLKPAR